MQVVDGSNAPLPSDANVRLPAGELAPPPVAVSVTVPVQLVAALIGSDAGWQETAVVVERSETVKPIPPVLTLSVALPPYEAEIVGLPVALGVNVTEQVAAAGGSLASVQLPPEENVPLPAVAKLTDPLGGLRVPASVSATVATHVVVASTASDEGLQETWVVVARAFTVSPVVPGALAAHPGIPEAPG